jgi:hypothetical protein
MGSKKYRVVIVAILAFASLGAFNSFANGSEPSDDSFLLGNPCSTAYVSQAIVDEKNPGKNLNVICYESSDISRTLIWTEDQNSTPSYKYPKGKVAFGRSLDESITADNASATLIKEKCTPNENLEPFVRDFPDTKCDLEKKVWWSKTYLKKIIVADFLPTSTPSPEPTPSPEATSSEPMGTKPIDLENGILDDASPEFVKSSILAAATYLAITTSAVLRASIPVPSQNSANSPGPNNSNRSNFPEVMELRSRRERKFGSGKGMRGFFNGPIISLDKWSFFTVKVPAFIRKIGKISSPAATIFGDADYLRASTGAFSLILYPVALCLGIFEYLGTDSTDKTSPIPSKEFLILGLILGCFDALAGAISAITFAVLFFSFELAGKSAGIHWQQNSATLISIFILTTGPALFAGAMRRFDGVHTNRTGRWERLVDYVLSPIVTAWIIWKVLEALPKIAGNGAEISAGTCKIIAAISWVLIVLRYFAEGVTAKHFALRINEIVTEAVPVPRWSRVFQYLRKGAWTWLLASVFLGAMTLPTWLLVGLVVLPGLALILRIEPSARFERFNISGTPRLGLMVVIGLILTGVIGENKSEMLNIKVLAVALIPVLYFSIMEALTESSFKAPAYFYKTSLGRILYRAASIVLFGLILFTIWDSVFKGPA